MQFPPAPASALTAFAYDRAAAYDPALLPIGTEPGVEIHALSFRSPRGTDRATGRLFVPEGAGPFAGLVLQHGMPGSAEGMRPYAVLLARHGAVVVALDAPFARRGGDEVRFSPADSVEQVQLMTDLQRAVDLLVARPDVDASRLGYLGISYGGAMGALFVGIERRIKAAVLVVPDGGLVSHFTGPEDVDFMASLSCATRNAWLRAMTPIEPIRFIGYAGPTALLLQNGRFDNLVPAADAQALHEAAPQPKTIRWYDAGHGLNQQAFFDRLDWLHEQIGLDPRP